MSYKVIDEGNDICFNDAHFEKVDDDIWVTDEGIISSSSEWDFLKALNSIVVIVDGIVMCFNDVQLRKVQQENSVIDVGIDSFVKDVQLSKIELIYVTDDGISISNCCNRWWN